MKNILIAVNFDENEEVLLEKGQQLAEAFKSKVWLIHIAAPDPEFSGYEVGPKYIREFRATELRNEHRKIQDYSKQFEQKGIESEGLLIQGATIEMVIKEAQKLNVDLIITGHQEHNFFYKMIVGSVSDGIIKRSKIPVLVIPFE